MILNGKKREYDISAAPTTSGAKVRTIGTKRASITVFTPYFSKNACAFATRLGLKTGEASRLKRVLPINRPVQYPVLSPMTEPKKNASIVSQTFSLFAAAKSSLSTNYESPGRKNTTVNPVAENRANQSPAQT